ncbi:MAG TPA: hypothetical protein VEC99_09205, partial [Clostridia bacterium]|nr:hypothetical protein [Clostridia bacterium]
MKQKILAGLMGMALTMASDAWSQPSDVWENWSIYEVYPLQPVDQIHAQTFINHKGASFSASGSVMFNTFETLNYTNQGVMNGNPGFDFEWVPSGNGQAKWANNFVNQASGPGPNSGVINCSGFTTIIDPYFPLGNLAGSSKCLVYATNIINSGVIRMSSSSLI